jgi:DNA-binding transcriptional MerR regulator
MTDEAYKTISYVASSLDLTASTLRFWEKEFRQIKPQMINKRRYYSQENIRMIEAIKALLHDKGYTLVGAKKYLKELKLPAAITKTVQSPLKTRLIELIALVQSAQKELEYPDK